LTVDWNNSRKRHETSYQQRAVSAGLLPSRSHGHHQVHAVKLHLAVVSICRDQPQNAKADAKVALIGSRAFIEFLNLNQRTKEARGARCSSRQSQCLQLTQGENDETVPRLVFHRLRPDELHRHRVHAGHGGFFPPIVFIGHRV
jgi:hypothetical protein